MTSNQDYQDLLSTAVKEYTAGNIHGFADACQALITADGDASESQFLTGVMAFLTEDPGLALQKVQSAYDMDTECGTYADALANLYARYGRLADSLYYAKLAPTLSEHPILGGLIVKGLDNYFVALAETKVPEFLTEAIRTYRSGDIATAIGLAEKQLRLGNNEADVFDLLGCAYLGIGEFEQAVSMFRSWIHLQPNEVTPRLYLADALKKLGLHQEAEACLLVALQRGGPALVEKGYAERFGVNHNAKALPMLGGNDEAEAALEPTGFQAPEKSADQPLRIGIVSDQFRSGRASALVRPWIENAVKGTEVFCYNLSDVSDGLSAQLKTKAAKWSEISDVDDQTLLYILDADGLDVLIDYTTNWYLSRDNVIAASNVNVVLGLGAAMDPRKAGPANHLLTAEGLVASDALGGLSDQKRLSAFTAMVAVSGDKPDDILPFPMTTVDRVSFGIDCDPSQLTAEHLATWAGVLTENPRARLVLNNSDYFSSAVFEQICKVFGDFGFADRLAVAKGGGTDFFEVIDIYLPTAETLQPASVLMAGLNGRPTMIAATGGVKGEVARAMMAALGMGAWVVDDWTAYFDGLRTLIADMQSGAITAKGVAQAVQHSAAMDSAGVIADAISGLTKACR